MDLRVCVVCRPAIAPGFELAGVRVEPSDEETVGERLDRLCRDPSVGVVLVEDRLRGAVPDAVARRIERQAIPLVASFPSPRWDAVSVAEAEVLEVLRQAVGYRVRAP